MSEGNLGHLKANLASVRWQNDRYRRILVYRLLEDVGVDPTTDQGLKAIDEYEIMVDAEADMSLMRFRTWLAVELGLEA